MPKIFLYLAAIALLGFFMTKNLGGPAKSWEPFYQGCMAGGGATDERCRCLTDYVHERLEQNEIQAVMENRVAGTSFQQKVERIVQQGSLSCQ
ncbi:MAG: hypothetical protein V7707_19050 [Motiliproteus sp.]